MIISQIYVVSYAFNDSLSIVSVDDSGYVAFFLLSLPGITFSFSSSVVFVHVTRFVTHMLPFCV
jgi:hypothetical protein